MVMIVLCWGIIIIIIITSSSSSSSTQKIISYERGEFLSYISLWCH
jgi:hypothetical protein